MSAVYPAYAALLIKQSNSNRHTPAMMPLKRTSSSGKLGVCLRFFTSAVATVPFLLGVSCSTYQPSRDFHAELAAMPDSGILIEGVRDIHRAGRKSGIIALAPLIDYWQRVPLELSGPLEEEESGVDLLFVEEAMAPLFEERNLWSFSFYGTMAEVEMRLEAGIPLLVMVQDNPMSLQTRRYMILVGFNRETKKLLVMEGGPYPGVYTYPEFRRIWRPVRNWVKVVCPPEKITWEMRSLELGTLARYRERRGEWSTALAQYDKAVEMDPQNLPFMMARARAMYESGDVLGAIVHFRRILDRDELNASAANNLAYILITTGGSLAESERLIRRALTIEPSNPAYLDTLGLTLLKAERPAEAVQVLSRAWQRSDHMSGFDRQKITRRLIQAYVESGHVHLARQVWNEQKGRDPDFQLDDALLERIME